MAQGLPWSPNGGTVVAKVIAQWMLLVGQRRHNGGTIEAEASTKLGPSTIARSTALARGRRTKQPEVGTDLPWRLAAHC